MTKPQRIHLMANLWPRVCRGQGWPAGDRELRLRVFSEAVGRPLRSASELNSTSDFDQVKAHLGMLVDNVSATVETIQPEQGRARRLRFLIRRVMDQLGQFGGDPHALLAKVCQDKFGRALDLDDLVAAPSFRTDPRTGEAREVSSQLDQVLFTLSRILSTKRKAARLQPT